MSNEPGAVAAARDVEPTVLDLAQELPLPDEAPARAPNDPKRALQAKPAQGINALPVGFRLMEYRIDAVLGQGGFGIAYAATDVNLNAKVVIKEYLPEDFAYRASDHTVSARADQDQPYYQNGLDNFLVEARTLATFRHPNIVRVARFFEANRTAYMVLEYERGQSLKAWRKKHEDLPEATLVSLLAPLLDGLALVHDAGYLHRDIKPDNIYVRDEDGSLVLLDFGAARQTAVEAADIGTIVTPGYGAIEQYAGGGRQGPWTDIYSCGATLFWFITGKKPVEAPARLEDPDPQPRAEDLCRGKYSPEFLCAIDWALRMHPSDRPQTVADFRKMLFASHAGALGLQEALRRGDDEGVERSRPRGLRARVERGLRLAVHPGSWPLGVKMAIAMMATAILPMAITAWYNLARTSEHVTTVELRNLEQLARSTAGRVSQLLADSRNLADYVGTDDDFVDYLRKPTPAGTKAILAKLNGLVKANQDLQFAMVMDTAGNAIVATDPAVMGKNFRFREYFKTAMEGRPNMTGIVVGSVAGAAGFFYSRPVFDANDRILGAVVMRIKAEPVAQILAAAQRNSGSERVPFLVDGDGVVVWHPDEKQMFRSLAALTEEQQARIAADQRFRRQRIESLNQTRLANAMVGASKAGNETYYSIITQREEIAGYAPVPGHDWVVGVSESKEYFVSPIDRMFRNTLISMTIVGGIFVVLALLFARSIVRPLERLTTAAHALKSGDYAGATVEVKTGDEVGQLARTFNVMIDVLRQRERERARNRALGRDGAD